MTGPSGMMTAPLRVLFVENGASEVALIREHLQLEDARFELQHAASASDAIETLCERSFDAILLRLSESGSPGLESFARLHPLAGSIPIVVLADEEEIGLRAIQAGAEDFLTRAELHARLLGRCVRYAVERRRAASRIEFQAQLLDQIGEALVATDTDGRIRYWNAAAQSLFGWSAEEVMGQPLIDVLPVEPAPPAEEEARRSTDRWTGEIPVRRKDGTRLLVGATLTTLRDSTGAVIGRIGISTDITDRRAAENALRESEQRLRLFVDTMPTIVWTTDTQLQITSIRGAGLRKFGDLGDRALGLNISAFGMMPQPVNSSRVLQGESVSVAAEWSGHAFDVHIEPMRDEEGTIIGTIGIALDVTDRRRSEQDAAQYFELLRTVLDAAPLAIIVVDEDARVSLWNRAAEEMLGWRSREVIGNPTPHIPPESRAEYERYRTRARESGRPERMTGRRITQDGRILDVVVTAAPVRTPDGQYHGTIAILEDVTQQRLSEETQRRLTAIIEASPDFVATFDVERRTLFMNRAGRELIGLSLGEDVSRTRLEQLCTEGTADELEREALPRVLADGRWVGEASLHTRSGGEVLVWMTLVAHRREDGDLGFISAVAQDISERRFLEEQLRQSQKMEAVGRLAGGVAHDFNNLLTAIAGHTELLLEDLGGNDSIRSDIEEVLRAVDRASTLTRQLLAFSRRQVLQPRLLDVDHVMTELGTLLRRLIGEDVELISSFDAGPARVLGDRGQIEQVVMNLVVNARDALPQGGTVELRTATREITEDSPDHRRGARPGRYVEITVADNGIGMDDMLMMRIFEPFFTTKEQGKGTGLGLATAYGIVTQSGGHMLVDSEPGRGSTFRVLLPYEVATAADDQENDSPRDDPMGSETVLLVEDEVAVRRLGCRILERKGYNVLEADSGAAAIRLFERMAPAITLLVTDIVMPGMRGSELARRLRAMKPSLRVLFTSGYTDDAISQEGVLEPGTAFLEKPFTPQALAQKVRDVLDQQES